MRNSFSNSSFDIRRFHKEFKKLLNERFGNSFNENHLIFEDDMGFNDLISDYSDNSSTIDDTSNSDISARLQKRYNNRFIDGLNNASIERQVEDVYNKEFETYYSSVKIKYPYKCDGYIKTKINGKDLNLLIEYKYNYNLKEKRDAAKVLIQVLYYLKKFENDGVPYPNVCFVGDINECFVMHTNELVKYLDEDVNWNISPSTAGINPDNTWLVNKIANDDSINPFVYDINNNFNFKNVVDNINDLAENVKKFVHVTEHNIANIFEYFANNVIKDRKKVGAHDLVSLFIGVITDPDNYYKHPSKYGTLVGKGKEYAINGRQYNAFLSHYGREYTPSEKMKFSEIADRLIEDTSRRNSGDFWTPTAWVDFAHKRISETLGENWKNEYVVWDNCCGSRNLTRDYKFKELYLSTLFESELDLGDKYNPEAQCFQFDFLNDYIPTGNELFGDCKLPKGLLDAFKQNKKIVFLINPPYAKNCGDGIRNTGTTQNISNTHVRNDMNNNKIGACSANLYAQFLYRIEKIKQYYKLKNCYICIFCPTLFITGTSYEQFRKYFLNDFKYINGFQFNAGHFSNVTSSWGIGFTIWKSEKNIDNDNFEIDICDINSENNIEIEETKDLYNVDNKITASDWIREYTKNIKTIETVELTSAIKIRDKIGTRQGKLIKNALGYFNNAGNNIDQNAQMVALFTSAYSGNIGTSIIHSNFTRCTALFSARKLIEKNWINSKDEYMAPDEENPKFQEFVNDSIIYSLFHSASNQSSLRNVDYKDKTWEIKNEFFWMPKETMMKFAEEYNNDECYNDARLSENRYVFNLLKNGVYDELSEEASAVLDAAIELVHQTFEYRQEFNDMHPEYQINNWDCGYYQLKALWKEYAPKEFNNFKELYKKLGDKMRPMVYELGFLKK